MEALTLIQNGESSPAGCACCAAPTTDNATTEEPAVSATTTDAAAVAVYTVSGMSCGHCVQSVTKEVSTLTGVSDVAVDLASGKVTVTSAAPLDLDAVKAAVDEAGYDLVA